MRDSYLCRVRGPRCTGRATSVHHIKPSSQFPHLFYAADNLISSCTACNSGEGASIASTNRATRATVDQLEQTIEQMQAEIDELHQRLAEHERPRPMPAIA